jgi:tRNA A-37 threonylcarbamoyl transferase component Bud32
MSYFWHISEEYKNTVLADVFSDLARAFFIQGELVSRNPVGHVIKVKIDGRFYFVKKYSRGGKRLRRFVGKSRVRNEWENLSFFSRLGIPTANIVAYGQESKWGLFKRGALITEELKDTTDLAELAMNQSPLLKDRDWIRQVILQVADFTKRMHDRGFVHNDLKWRNILVTCGKEPEVFFIDCPVGKKWSGPVLRRGFIKDLACLDKVAKYQLSRTTRLWFYKVYSGRSRLTKADKLLIKRVLTFFSGRE